MMTKKKLLATLALWVLAATAFSCNQESGASGQSAAQDLLVAQPEEHHLSLLIAGDLMQHGPQLRPHCSPTEATTTKNALPA